MFFDPKFFSKTLKMTHIEVILCGKSIAHISEFWKCFPDPDSRYCIEATMEKVRILIIFASIQYPESESGKHFQCSEMCAIDFPHKVTPRGRFQRK
jgi:hypothetical protein